MKSILKQSLGLLITIGAMQVAADDLHINPGLWVVQHHGTMGNNGISMPIPDATQLQGLMKNLPPQARAQIEKHVGANGTAMAAGQDVKVCVSKEQAAKNEFPTDPTGKCKLINNTRTGNTIAIKMQCSKGDVDAVITLHDATWWSSTMKGSAQNGAQNYTMDMQATGKWLGNDCGTLKPFVAAKQNSQ